MDPLTVTTGVIACLQTTCSILTWCYGIRADMKSIPLTLIEIINEVRGLRNVIESVESAWSTVDRSEGNNLRPTQNPTEISSAISPIIANCLSELQDLENRVRPEQVHTLLTSKRKVLLQSLLWRLKGNEAKEYITRLQRCKGALTLAITSDTSVTVRNIERLSVSLNETMGQASQQLGTLAQDFSTTKLDKHYKALLQWLSPLKPGQAHLQVQSSHQPGTSKWLQSSKPFQEWLHGVTQILWISGPPGSGKTVMMSQIIERFSSSIAGDEHLAYAFVYCDFRNPETQNITNILGSLLGQLCVQLDYFPEDLLDAYKSSMDSNQGSGPTIEMISEAIRMLSTNQKVCLFIDAMDEAGDFKCLAKALISLRTSKSRIKTLVTSRNEVSIQKVFYDVPRVSLEHHMVDIDEEIEQYVTARLTIDPDLEWLSPNVRNLVTDSLLGKSKGSFRWATCQLDALCDCKTVREIKRSLESLPEGLNATYSRQLARLAPSDIPLVNRIMAWLSFSFVPITLHQLWEALAIENGTAEIDDESRLRSPQDILLLGSSLISVSLDGYVMLSHLSVRDYLISSEIRLNPATVGFALETKTCHLNLGQDCLTYLMFSELSSGPSNIQEDYLLRLQRLPLLQYATRYWFYHARNAEYNEHFETLCHRFFSPGARQNFMSWVQAINADTPLKWNVFPTHATSLYYAASLGLERVITPLIESSTVDELNAAGSRFGGTAIHAAALRDHTSIIEKLASAGADVNKADYNHVTPLHSAAARRKVETIKILLHYGASNETLDSMDGKTPATWARLSGHESAARLIEEYSRTLELERESELYCSEELGDESDSKDSSRAIDVWQPGTGYFPDYYERRSGLGCSCIIGMTIGEKKLVVDGSIALGDDGDSPNKAKPVW